MSDKPNVAAGLLGAPRIDFAMAKTAYARDAAHGRVPRLISLRISHSSSSPRGSY
jgi:hypothetical protein